MVVYGCVLTAACKCLFFEKVRFQDDLIFLYFMDAESIQLFIQVMVHEISQVKGAFPAEFFDRGGIDMAEGQIERVLVHKPQSPKVRTFWKDIPQFDMFIFKGNIFL